MREQLMFSRYLILTAFLINLSMPAVYASNKIHIPTSCPEISQLYKDPESNAWQAKGGWKSYESSFASKIGKFIGAQWRGIRVGTIFCVYLPADQQTQKTFPIILQYNKLVNVPSDPRQATQQSSNHWGKDLGGYRNCKATNPKECPFSPRVVIKRTDIYQQAEKLHQDATKELAF